MYGQRWYNPATGRFTQQDSIERYADPKQGNRYAYAADNPINYVDPTGKDVDWGDFAKGTLFAVAGSLALVASVPLLVSCPLVGPCIAGLATAAGGLTALSESADYYESAVG